MHYKYFTLSFLFLLTTCIGCQEKRHVQKQNQGSPNIMVIVLDDLGYSDLGCYGGEISTPNIDKLAEDGLRFTQFYNASRCSPSRASLLTGLYQHRVGLQVNGHSLNRKGVTIAEVLKESGYQTGMTGKWHLSQTYEKPNVEEHMEWLANRSDFSDFAPRETYPVNRGFDEHFGVIWGVVNYFDPFSLVHNETPIKEVPDDFYITDFVTDKTVDLIDRFSKNEDPFFLYVAHPAPHWPLHARPEDVQKYQGVYDKGWDELRKERYERLISLGIIDAETAPNSVNESGASWEENPYKEWEAAHMEAHAAMVDRVDQGIGKVLQKLKDTGEYENTVIFILSDNGGSPERVVKPGFDRPAETRDGREIKYFTRSKQVPEKEVKVMEAGMLKPPGVKYTDPSAETSMAGIGPAWAGAVNTPYRYWKVSSHHGGIATPFIVHWPAGLRVEKGSINKKDVGHVMDIMPTCLDIAGAEYPESYKGNAIFPMDGKSLLPVFKGQKRNGHDVIFWEHANRKAVRVGNWKLAAWKGFEWELFNLEKDLTETNDLAEEYPERVKEMAELWHEYAEEVGYDPNAKGPTR